MQKLKRIYERLLSISLYIGLDIIVGIIAYRISHTEPELTDGQLMLRIMSIILLANGILGGPDAMMFWRESGRRIEAEQKMTEAIQEQAETAQKLAKAWQKQAETAQDLAESRQKQAEIAQKLTEALQRQSETDQERDAANARIRELEAELAQRGPSNDAG